jgi:hypothetical protein
MKDIIYYQGGLVLFTLIGIGFGFTLEGSGFGRAPVLAAQFYGSNMRVLKVMFTAILTALVGMTLLAGFGVLDLNALHVPQTFLWPQLVAGLMLGAGFVVCGYCPGTSVVATASGNMDGLVAFLGIIAGSLTFGLVYPNLEGFYESSGMGVFRLTDLLGLSQATLTLAIVFMAIGAFVLAERIESALARRRGETPPRSTPAIRNRVLAGILIASLLGMFVSTVPPETISTGLQSAREMEAMELAERIVEQHPPLYIVDLRQPGECGERRIPGAMCLSDDDPEGRFLADLPPTRDLVLYGEQDLDALPDPVKRFEGTVFVLKGGFSAFAGEILAEPTLPDDPEAGDIDRYRLLSAMYAFFTGTSVQKNIQRPAVKPRKFERVIKKGGGC